jgi:hypothetical protein
VKKTGKVDLERKHVEVCGVALRRLQSALESTRVVARIKTLDDYGRRWKSVRA